MYLHFLRLSSIMKEEKQNQGEGNGNKEAEAMGNIDR